MKKLVLTALLISTMSMNAFSESIDISVKGTISPAACTPLASDGGMVDYGFISPGKLSADKPTVLPAKTISFTITCDAKINVALRALSNRLSSVTDFSGTEGPTGGSAGSAELIAAGLGKNLPLGLGNVQVPTVLGVGYAPDQSKIGGYMMNLPFTTVKLDGVSADAKYYSSTAPTSETTWNRNSSIAQNGDTLTSSGATYYAYGAPSVASDSGTTNASAKPTPFQELTGTLVLQAYITKTQDLDITQPINLDGSATIELYYF